MYVESVESAEDIWLDDFPAVLVKITGVKITGKTVRSRRLFTGQIFYCLLNLIFCEGTIKFKARQLPQGV